ncbi:autotransporter domain-containing protein [Methyloversatilis sp.]|uniref:autotransporter outer membrane beta-barrel domain-containing protein n=1 Tax=Methyloversatilis sp. TaxID=2569862 RepID=UPI00273477E8|nr:autotransporter domain-containing protein [Methyloversatilis sp.]MDP2868408.1 autotransporter domain-containing protein [Methyloversatilis sp.]MDP3457331.1 autotransporter domain-containing protein [Methyloversatilis sp.]
MQHNRYKARAGRWTASAAFVLCTAIPAGRAVAACNGGVTVTSTIVVSASCNGGSTTPLRMNTGANVTINSGVTVSNSSGSGRNGDPVSVLSTSTSATLTNNGSIYTAAQWGITNNGTLDALINTGTIASGVRRAIVNNGGTIGTITNTGTVTGPFADITASGGSIGTLNNLQGAGNAGGALTYAGDLPTRYNIIINGPGTYGVLAGAGAVGATTFGIYDTSTVATGTYSGVLTGLGVGNLGGATSGNFGGLSWTLNLASGSSTVWDLVFAPAASDITTGGSFALDSVGVTTNPVFDGGTLTLAPDDASARAFTVNGSGGTVTTPSGGSATLSGVLSGAGGLTVNGSGRLTLSGLNTYAGGTTIASGTVAIDGDSALGSGAVFVAPGAMLMGTGTIDGPVTVAGTFKPGNSPGFIGVNATVTQTAGSTYQQDIAGTVQAASTTPAGSTGFYSFLEVTGGQFVIQPGATLTPQLLNLFTPGEPGFGSAPHVPALGERFRIITADGGINGRFSTLTQPAGLAAGTQFAAFYDMAGSRSIDLLVIPLSYRTALADGNANARSAADLLDRLVELNLAGTAGAAQTTVLQAAATQGAAALPSFARALAGELHGATLAVVPQTTLRLQQAVMTQLGRATGVRSKAWGEMAYQRGDRSGDDTAGGFSSHLYQLAFGADTHTADGRTLGTGFALSTTRVSARSGSGTVQQGTLFVYGQRPVSDWMLDGMASFGLNSTDNTRNDPLGSATALDAHDIHGRDALVSLGIGRAHDVATGRVTPYARLTWQHVRQSAFNEGDSAAALGVRRFSDDGLRAVLGVTLASAPTFATADAAAQRFSYRAHLGVGADTSDLLQPRLNTTLAGITMTLRTPDVGSTFVQAGVSATARVAVDTVVQLGLAGEVRQGAALGNVNLDVIVRF